MASAILDFPDRTLPTTLFWLSAACSCQGLGHNAYVCCNFADPNLWIAGMTSVFSRLLHQKLSTALVDSGCSYHTAK